MSPDSSSTSINARVSPAWVWLTGWPAAAVLLAVYAVLAVTATLSKTVTFDEVGHLPAGLSYWTLNQYTYNPENGNLPQRWGALPLALAGYRLPPLSDAQWSSDYVWTLGQGLVFGAPGQAERVLPPARSMMVLLGVAAGALVYGWSRRLFGRAGGMLSLALFAFCPNFLAHGPLVTSDVAAALFFTAASGALWLLMQRLTPWTVLCAGGAIGAMCLSKMSAPLLGPVGLLLLIWRLWAGRPLILGGGPWRRVITSRWQQTGWLAGGVFLAVLLAWAMIWAALGFRFPARLDAAGQDAGGAALSGWALATPGWVTSAVLFVHQHRLLPEAYALGFAQSMKLAGLRSAVFNGEYSLEGWRLFFPYTFLVKTPLATLLVFALALAAAVPGNAGLRSRWRLRVRRGFYRTAPLWVFLGVYWTAAIFSHLNIGVRHLLPVYVAAFILAGAAGRWLLHRRWILRAAMLLLLVILARETLLAWPDYIPYFNQIAGGPKQGYKHLVDSSLDWGQDLPGLQRWLATHGLDRPAAGAEPRVYLCYFGNGNINYYGIRATVLPGFNIPDQTPPSPISMLEPGVYCISATMLQCVYNPQAPGPKWLPEYESRYRTVASLAVPFLNAPDGSPQRARMIEARGMDFWKQVLEAYQMQRLARLFASLRVRAPDAQVGHSILIYRVSARDLDEALPSPPPPAPPQT